MWYKSGAVIGCLPLCKEANGWWQYTERLCEQGASDKFAALRIAVGGFPIRTAVKIVTRCAVFFAAVHSLLRVVKYSIKFALQLTYNLGTLQFSCIWNSAILSVSFVAFCQWGFSVAVFSPLREWCDLWCYPSVSCFTIVSSVWERVIGGAGSGRDLCVCVCVGGIYVCVWQKEREGKQERGRECSVCVNVFACNWMRNGQWIEWLLLCCTGWDKRHN